MCAAGELETGAGLVADFEAFQLDDAHIFRAAFPDLALLQFHQKKICLSRARAAGETVWVDLLFLLSGDFLFRCGFLGGFLRFGFGGHDVSFLFGLCFCCWRRKKISPSARSSCARPVEL